MSLYPLSQAQRTTLFRWPPVWLTTKPCCGESGVLQYMAMIEEKAGEGKWGKKEQRQIEERAKKEGEDEVEERKEREG